MQSTWMVPNGVSQGEWKGSQYKTVFWLSLGMWYHDKESTDANLGERMMYIIKRVENNIFY